ncbi:MAG: hypothetical protein NAG76_01975 [Candidatus Pristimantibacillus lignocellulolyticus]|uniref:Uncharacterized protein n=1 Tax=Candidatus Pristimantibacillus lignocellulolyticus TaxID=2994561 RepID=A0A9J6ZH46_9BACL|nr:MAG: hypothetical protein NAG76_01975 [Candidatus Pristimantibacillus lignocellulolyticus]
MKFKKIMIGVMSTSLLMSAFAMPTFAAKLPGAQYSTVQLEAVPTKEMTYYKNGSSSIPADLKWITDSSALEFLPLSVIGDVTSVVLDEGVYWIGTENGLQRVNFSEKNANDIVQYFAGPRYLYGGDGLVTGLASDNEGGIWVRNASGVTHIAMPEKTMAEKNEAYERVVRDVHDRYGLTSYANFNFTETDGNFNGINYSSDTGILDATPSTSDNDGLWTSMYGMGEIFRFAALTEQYGTSPTIEQQAEINEAKTAAIRATKAVLLLSYVSGRGNGFPARSFMLTSEASAATTDGTIYGQQSQNGFWFQHVVGEDAVNPNGIIPSMEIEGQTPIGYSIVRVTKDAMTKKGSRLFPSGGTDVMNYNGIALSNEAINALNETRADGEKLGTDIYTIVETVDGEEVHQVLPVITTVTNKASAKEDKTTNATNKPIFQLTAPVYEQIPTYFNDLFPSSAINGEGNIDMNQIVYKADTSSDEVDGHFALLYTAYKYLIGDTNDVELLELKSFVEKSTHHLMELILNDDHYYVEDATGKATQWSRWIAQYFNDGIGNMKQKELWKYSVGVDENGDDALSYGYEDGPLNVLQIMSFLKAAIVITENSDMYSHDTEKYKVAYELAFNGGYSTEAPYVNGKGYINIAQEYIERRIIRQATSAYSINGNQVVSPGTWDINNYTGEMEDDSNINGTLHNDWTQYINYSDEELGWFPIFVLTTAETDPAKHALIAAAFDQWYENEIREENPFYTFLYQIVHPEKTDVELEAAVRYLYRLPQYLITFPVEWNRQDVLYIEPGYRDDYVQTNYVLAPDERKAMKNNTNPFEADGQMQSADPNYNYNYGGMEVGFTFTIPYWLGRYFEIIKE